jgi:hypothetical protein
VTPIPASVLMIGSFSPTTLPRLACASSSTYSKSSWMSSDLLLHHFDTPGARVDILPEHTMRIGSPLAKKLSQTECKSLSCAKWPTFVELLNSSKKRYAWPFPDAIVVPHNVLPASLAKPHWSWPSIEGERGRCPSLAVLFNDVGADWGTARRHPSQHIWMDGFPGCVADRYKI